MKSQRKNQNEDLQVLLASLKNQIKENIQEGLIYLKTEKSPAKIERRKIELEEFCNEIKNCKLCSLYKTRNNFVFGEGNVDLLTYRAILSCSSTMTTCFFGICRKPV